MANEHCSGCTTEMHKSSRAHHRHETPSSSSLRRSIDKSTKQTTRLKTVRRRLQDYPLVFFIISLLMISFLQSYQTDAVLTDHHQPSPKYMDDERRILRHLFLKRFGLDQLVESSPPQSLNTLEVVETFEKFICTCCSSSPTTSGSYTTRRKTTKKRIRLDTIFLPHQPTKTSFGLICMQLTGNHTKSKHYLFGDLPPRFRRIEHADLRIRLPSETMRGQLNVYDRLGRLLDSKHLPQLFSRDSWVDLDVTSTLQSVPTNNVRSSLITLNCFYFRLIGLIRLISRLNSFRVTPPLQPSLQYQG